MNTAFLLAVVATEVPIMAKIFFWILLGLWAIGSIGYRDNPNVVRGSRIVALVLFAILGWYTFGF